ncbi:hypothetical protein KIPB_011198, partial [Kipferlia bialata]
IIAMGFPSTGLESSYRNPWGKLVGFLDERHPGSYRVYNLCIEKDRQYDADIFHGNVACYPFPDHNAPPFDMLLAMCEDADAWLKMDPQNVIAVHCKAGKGRTGVMIAAYLLFSGMWSQAIDSLSFYGAMRTKNGKGVTIPSQRR